MDTKIDALVTIIASQQATLSAILETLQQRQQLPAHNVPQVQTSIQSIMDNNARHLGSDDLDDNLSIASTIATQSQHHLQPAKYQPPLQPLLPADDASVAATAVSNASMILQLQHSHDTIFNQQDFNLLSSPFLQLMTPLSPPRLFQTHQ